MGFDGPGAARAPTGGNHLFDESEFEIAGGLEMLDVLSEKGLKRLGRFVFENQAASQKAVAQGVLRGAEFARGGGGAFGTATVGAGGLDSSAG